MDLLEPLLTGSAREFGAHRGELPRACLWGADAAERMAALLREEVSGDACVVLFDARTRAAAGTPCVTALRALGFSVQECLVEDAYGASPVCDDVTMRALQARLPRADVMVAVGSGVINDLTKWLAAEAHVPYAVCATAASMNGYTAANVAPTVQGVKSLFRARAPRVVAAHPAVVANAPHVLTTAGLGDVIAKPVSTADWIVNHHVLGEPFNPAVATIINQVEPRYLEHPEALAGRDEAAIRALFEALIHSGCAMTLQGSSLPASGGEHLISHALDMMAHVDGTAHDLHGRQVGVATIFVAECYQRVMALEPHHFQALPVTMDPRVWGGLAPAVAVEHAHKVPQVEAVWRYLRQPGHWDALRRELSNVLRGPDTVKACLAKAGGAHRVRDLGIPVERFLTAVHHCGAIRRRFTSMDLMVMAGVLPAAAESIVEQWLT